MAFNPTSTIYLCKVDFDNSYKHQVYFYNKNQQEAYFRVYTQKTFTNYLTVRRTASNGSLISSVKVSANIDDLYNCNYMFYQNANHGNKYFYAFITNLVYVNEGTTEIIFETDVFQTWLFDTELLPSYVVREHSTTDNRGDNIVPESFNIQEYTYVKYPDGATGLGEWGYLVASSEGYSNTGESIDIEPGCIMTNIYQGLYFYFFKNPDRLKLFLKNANPDNIVSITLLPNFNITSATFISDVGAPAYGAEGRILEAPNIPNHQFTFNPSLCGDLDGYTPKNNKLFTAPYFMFVVSNNSGDEAEYVIEDFTDPTNIKLKMFGDISVNPSITLVPCNYKNVVEFYPGSITIKNLPQCSYNTDTYKLWLAKNQFGVGLGALSSVGQIIAGAAMIGTGGGALAGAGMIGTGAVGVANSINSIFQASKDPNRSNSGNAQTNLLTALGKNKFDFYLRCLKHEPAQIIDEFFTMYGYQTNKVKVPNVDARPFFNYIQTIDCNIKGNIPNDDMEKLKAMYNNGVTLWAQLATIGNYNVDNSPN